MSEHEKAISALRARFALLGHSVFELADGGFVVTRLGAGRNCPDATALGRLLRQLGGGGQVWV